MRKLNYVVLRAKVIIFRCYKQKCFLLLIISVFILATVFQFGFGCSNIQPMKHIQNECISYGNGESIGNLCRQLCHPQGVSPVSCHSYMQIPTAFSGTWKNNSVIFKKVANGIPHQFNKNQPTEADFVKMIQTLVKSKFNMIPSDVVAKDLSYHLKTNDASQRSVEMENTWRLLQDNEYLAMILYGMNNIFPRIVGSCGSLYAVEKLGSISGYWHFVTLYDTQEEWKKRIAISISILDFLQRLEFGVPEPLHICDVKMHNFGVNNASKIMYLDLDSVHPFTIANKYTADGSSCKHHSDCDYYDCRSLCNLITFKCQYGVVNNNLQIVCEKIFLGWVMSGKVMVPGLLLGPRSPRVLLDLLQQCANPSRETGTPRSPASKEIRKRLYDLLNNFLNSATR